METSLKECLDHFLDFEEVAVFQMQYDDGSVIPMLYWPKFFRCLRILRNHVTANLALPIGKLAEIPLRKTLTLLNQLEVEYPPGFWDQIAVEGVEMFEVSDPFWSRIDASRKKDIRRLYFESYKAMANTIEPDQYDEFFHGIDLDRREVKWRGKTYKPASSQLLLVLHELALRKGAPITNAALRASRTELQDLEVKSLRKLSGADDQSLVKLIKASHAGFELKLPRMRSPRKV